MKFTSGERLIDTQHQKGYRRPIDKLRPMTSLLIYLFPNVDST